MALSLLFSSSLSSPSPCQLLSLCVSASPPAGGPAALQSAADGAAAAVELPLSVHLPHLLAPGGGRGGRGVHASVELVTLTSRPHELV